LGAIAPCLPWLCQWHRFKISVTTFCWQSGALQPKVAVAPALHPISAGNKTSTDSAEAARDREQGGTQGKHIERGAKYI